MFKLKRYFIIRIHLIISVLVVIPAAIIYGFNPEQLFDIYLNTVNEQNAFKAFMGLYIGFSILWILGIFNTSFLKTALITHVVFMLGLGFGRLLSTIADGFPTLVYTFGMFGELVLGCYGIWILKKQMRNGVNFYSCK